MVLGNWGHEALTPRKRVVLAHAGPEMGAEGPLLSVQLWGMWQPPHRVCTVALCLLRLQQPSGHLFQQTEHFLDPRTGSSQAIFPERYTLGLRKGPSLQERGNSARRSAKGSQAETRCWGAWATVPCGQVWACYPSPSRVGRHLPVAVPGSRSARAWGRPAWLAGQSLHPLPGLWGASSRLRSRSAPRPAAGPAGGPDSAAGRSRGRRLEGHQGAQRGGRRPAALAETAQPGAGRTLGVET